MNGMGFRLGRAFGVELTVDWSLLIIFVLVLVNLALGVFPAWHPEWSTALSWIVSLFAAVMFFGSVLVHELSHALMARRHDVPVKRITLFLFGGVAHMDEEPRSPKAELLIAVVGPLTSILIGVASIALGGFLASRSLAGLGVDDAGDVIAFMARIGPVATLLLWLGQVNLLLGVFNLVPGFPLDGGRVMRAILWHATKDLRKATRWASNAGRGFAWFLMGFGAVSLFQGAFGQGIWLILIGWFLNYAAAMSYQQLVARQALEGVTADDVMTRAVTPVVPELSVDALVRDHLMASEQRAFPVVADGVFLGLVCLEDVRRAPRDRWHETSVRDVMTPRERLVTLAPDDEAERALRLLGQGDFDQLPVLEGDRLLGLVQRRGLMRWLTLHGDEERSHAGAGRPRMGRPYVELGPRG